MKRMLLTCAALALLLAVLVVGLTASAQGFCEENPELICGSVCYENQCEYFFGTDPGLVCLVIWWETPQTCETEYHSCCAGTSLSAL